MAHALCWQGVTTSTPPCKKSFASLQNTKTQRRRLRTIDYTTKPYARWLEEVLPQMIEFDPVSIGIVMILPDESTGTVYYNVDRRDMAIMQQAIADDSLADYLRVNADIIAQILSGEEDEEDGICEPDTETDSEG